MPKFENYKSESEDKTDTTVAQKSPIIAAAETSNPKPASDLIAIYPFNGNANDESGSENHGTVYGASPVKDRFGNEESAYSFDGVIDDIRIYNRALSKAEILGLDENLGVAVVMGK